MIPWLPTQKVNERVIRHADEFVTKTALDECPLRLLPVGSTLVALYGEGTTRGKAAYLAFEACINQAFACVMPNEPVDQWYLFYCLEDSYEALRAYSQGSNQKNLNCQLLARFQIPLPPKVEQEKIVGTIRLLDAKLEQLETHLKVVTALKSRLMASLAT